MVLLLAAVIAVTWQKRAVIGRALARLAAPFVVPPAIELDANGVQFPEKVDWSVYDAPAYLRRSR